MYTYIGNILKSLRPYRSCLMPFDYHKSLRQCLPPSEPSALLQLCAPTFSKPPTTPKATHQQQHHPHCFCRCPRGHASRRQPQVLR